MLAAIRPDSWNYALFLHVLGATVLVGALVTAGSTQISRLGARKCGGAAIFARFASGRSSSSAIPA